MPLRSCLGCTYKWSTQPARNAQKPASAPSSSATHTSHVVKTRSRKKARSSSRVWRSGRYGSDVSVQRRNSTAPASLSPPPPRRTVSDVTLRYLASRAGDQKKRRRALRKAHVQVAERGATACGASVRDTRADVRGVAVVRVLGRSAAFVVQQAVQPVADAVTWSVRGSGEDLELRAVLRAAPRARIGNGLAERRVLPKVTPHSHEYVAHDAAGPRPRRDHDDVIHRIEHDALVVIDERATSDVLDDRTEARERCDVLTPHGRLDGSMVFERERKGHEDA